MYAFAIHCNNFSFVSLLHFDVTTLYVSSFRTRLTVIVLRTNNRIGIAFIESETNLNNAIGYSRRALFDFSSMQQYAAGLPVSYGYNIMLLFWKRFYDNWFSVTFSGIHRGRVKLALWSAICDRRIILTVDFSVSDLRPRVGQGL